MINTLSRSQIFYGFNTTELYYYFTNALFCFAFSLVNRWKLFFVTILLCILLSFILFMNDISTPSVEIDENESCIKFYVWWVSVRSTVLKSIKHFLRTKSPKMSRTFISYKPIHYKYWTCKREKGCIISIQDCYCFMCVCKSNVHAISLQDKDEIDWQWLLPYSLLVFHAL